MKLVRIESVAELRRLAHSWDDLWERCEATLPTLRCELLAQWVEHFAPAARFLAVAVESEDRLIAALPLVGGRRRVANLPTNAWSMAGDLLLDPNAPADSALHLLCEGLKRLPWLIIHGEGAPIDSRRWRLFFETLREHGHATAARKQFDVGVIDLGGDWSTYQASLSGNHRRALGKSLRKLQADGRVELKVHRHLSPDEAERLLRIVCEIEDKSWKGEAGTSILRTPGMLDYYRREAQQLAALGHLEILLLEHEGRPIAAEYGYAAKGVSHSHKIAYDPEFSYAGPGRLLRYLQLERYFDEGQYHLLDTLGILSEANAKWSTRSYSVSRVLISTGGPIGQALVGGYKTIWPHVRKLLRRSPPPPAEKLGAAGYLDAVANDVRKPTTRSRQPANPC